jgi:hypothetical protein
MCLRAGACIEVWAPDGPPIAAMGALHGAHARWRHLTGQRGGVGGSTPWSFHYLAATNPDHLTARLAALGLPPDWTPSPAPAEWKVTSAEFRRDYAQSWHPKRA